MPAMNHSILEMKRNDVDAAMEYVDDAIKHGGLTEDESEMLFMLQDDPTELIEKINAVLGISDA